MRNFNLLGWILIVVTISGCATPDGIHRLAASMGTKVETYRLPDDFVMPPFPEIPDMESLLKDSQKVEDLPVDPFCE